MLYRSEVRVSGAVVNGFVGSLDITTTTPWVTFSAHDATHSFGILWSKQHNTYAPFGSPIDEWKTRAYMLWVSNPLPDADELHTIFPAYLLGDALILYEADGNNGAAYDAGGVLAIEKDTTAETITWVTPIGSATLNWSDPAWEEAGFPFPVTDSVLTADLMEHALARSSSAGTDENDLSLWEDFYSYLDGDIFKGAALSAADPGVWTPWVHDPFLGGGGTIMDNDEAQLTSRYQTGFHYVDATDFPRFKGAKAFRRWDDSAAVTGVDLATASEHGLIFAALVLLYQQYRMRYRRTYNGGRDWITGIVYEEPGETMSWPSVSWWQNRVTVVFGREPDILQSVSFTAGDQWETVMVLPYTGTFPRHIVHPDHGLYLYFFFDGTTLKVARSADYGHTFIDASPVTIDTGLSAQQIDAEIAFDGSIIVTYFDAGVWTQQRSFNGGVDWQL